MHRVASFSASHAIQRASPNPLRSALFCRHVSYELHNIVDVDNVLKLGSMTPGKLDAHCLLSCSQEMAAFKKQENLTVLRVRFNASHNLLLQLPATTKAQGVCIS